MKLFHPSATLLIFLILIQGCENKSATEEEPSVSFNSPITNNKKIHYQTLHLDSLLLDPVPTSFVGKISIPDNRLLFIDQKLCWVFEFDSTGKLVSTHIGQGKKPDELPTKKISFFAPTSEGGYFFIGSSWDCFVFDRHFHRTDDYEINWHLANPKNEPAQRPDPSQTDVYSLAYTLSNILIDHNTIYLPLFAQARTFNPTTPGYDADARVLATMDIRDGYVNKLMGRLSPMYLNNKAIQTLSYLSFDLVPGDKMLISYPADSLIYVSDRNFHILSRFGASGRAINTDYIPLDHPLNLWKVWYKQTQEKGYYRSIKYIPQRQLLFRSYQKDKYPASDGLQIYRGDTLVADLDVPRGFNVEGYIAPFFYSNSFMNEEKETITIYKFKLDSYE